MTTLAAPATYQLRHPNVGQALMLRQRIATVLVVLLCFATLGCTTTGDAVRGSWVAESSSPDPLVSGSTITIAFDGRTVTGSAGCNSYGAQAASVSNGILIMGETASTAMACVDTRLMEQEERFYTLLKAPPRIQVDGDRLVLTSDAMSMTFRRA